MINRWTIRTKLTLMNIIILVIVSLILTILSEKSAITLIESVPTTPAQYTSDNSYSYGENLNVTEEVNLDPNYQVPTELSRAKKIFKTEIYIYMLMVISFGGLLTFGITKMMLKSMEVFEKQLELTTIDSLSKEIVVPNAEPEIACIVKKFNDLKQHLNSVFESQERFSQSAAHELKTPLTVVIAKLEVFNKKNNRSKEEYDKLLDSIYNQTSRLTNLVDDLLNLIQRKDISLEEDVSINELVDSVFDELVDFSEEKNLSVTLKLEKIEVKGNVSLLHRLIYNLIENAIAYNVDEGDVEIVLYRSGGNVHLEVRDTGIGIPDDMKRAIFEPFVRVDSSRSRNLGGSGLGLSMVTEIAKKHKAIVSVEDQMPKGTIFKVTFFS